MSKKLQWQNHPSNPAAQPFNVKGRRNLTKSDSWWNPSSKRFWRDAKKDKKGAV